MSVPFLHWPEGTLVKIEPSDALEVTAPEGEKRFCYVRLKKKQGTMHVAVRVAGEASSVSATLGLGKMSKALDPFTE